MSIVDFPIKHRYNKVIQYFDALLTCAKWRFRMKLEVEAYIKYLKEVKTASKNTLASYHNDLFKFIHFLEGSNIDSFDKISETSVNTYILGMEKSGFSPATVARNIASVKSFILYLIKNGKLSHDPTDRIKAPKVARKIPQALSVEEMNRLLDQPDRLTKKGLRDSAMLELLYATGIRVSELLAIKMNDVNLKNSFILCDNETKSRLVPFGKVASLVLENYINYGRKEFLGEEETDILFLNINGKPMSRQGFWKLMKSYAKKAQIEHDITPQLLRHTCAIHLVSNGADLHCIQELLGHSDISTTQIYNQAKGQKVRDMYMNSHPRA